MLNHMANQFLPYCEMEMIDESVESRRIFYRLGDSEFFQFANKNTIINGIQLVDVLPRMVVEDQGFLHIDLNQFDKNVVYELFESGRFKINCKGAIKNLIDSGKVVPVYSETYKIPTSIPYIVQTAGKTIRVFVNVSDFVTLDQYGKYQVTQTRNYNGLMAVLFAASAAYRIISSIHTLPSDLGDGMVLTYASMFTEVVNSMLHLDPTSKDKLKYLATEFALVQMYGTETGTNIFHRYKMTYFPKLTKLITDSIDSQFQIDSFDNMTLFIEQLKKMYPSMKGLSTYLVFDKWIRKYGAVTAMSIDYIGYHLYTICMVLLESPLITRNVLEPILVKNRGADMFKRLQLMISD